MLGNIKVQEISEMLYNGTTAVHIGEIIATIYASPLDYFSKSSIRFVGLDHNDIIHIDVFGHSEFKAFLRFNIPLRIFDTFITPIDFTENYGILFSLESIIPDVSVENSKLHQHCKGDYRAFKIRPS